MAFDYLRQCAQVSESRHKEELELCRVLQCLLTSQGNWEEVEKEDTSLLPISHSLHVTCKCVWLGLLLSPICLLTWPGNLQIYLSHIWVWQRVSISGTPNRLKLVKATTMR